MADEKRLKPSEKDSAASATRVRWEVIVLGEGTDLVMLEKSFSDRRCRIAEVGNEYVISSDAWNKVATTQEVQAKAKNILSIISGSARLKLGTGKRLMAGSVYEVLSDGSRATHILASIGRAGIRALPVTITAGGKVYHPADPVRDDVQLASRDDHVALALRLWDKSPLDWDDLFRVFEIIEDDCGSTIQREGWASKNQCDSFTQNAAMNRHPIRTIQSPKKSMSENDARKFIVLLLKSWIEWKQNS